MVVIGIPDGGMGLGAMVSAAAGDLSGYHRFCGWGVDLSGAQA